MRSKTKRDLFRTSRAKRKKKPINLLVEGVIFMALGTTLTIFLNSIPKTIIFKDFSNDIWISFSEGIILLFESLIILIKATSVIMLILLSLILLIGGIIRFIRFISLIKKSFKDTNSSKY
tara:strand:+ start:139 stop:498 length:360 start_codon:yes stop_codon:yes gene_type:complete